MHQHQQSNSYSSGQAQGDTRLEQNRQAAWQSTPEHKTWQWQTRITHPQLVARAVPQHHISTERNREHNSSQQSKHHTADFTARAEHGHTEQSLAHATVHEHKHPVETLLDQKRIAEHTSQSRAQDSSTHRRAQLAHTPQSAISSQLGS